MRDNPSANILKKSDLDLEGWGMIYDLLDLGYLEIQDGCLKIYKVLSAATAVVCTKLKDFFRKTSENGV